VLFSKDSRAAPVSHMSGNAQDRSFGIDGQVPGLQAGLSRTTAGDLAEAFLRSLSRTPHSSTARAAGLVSFLMPLIAACAAAVPLEQAGVLSSYQHLAPSSGFLTQAQVSVNKDEILAAKTVRIIPTSLSAAVAEAKLSEAQLTLIANAVDRSLCSGLSDRFHIVPRAQPADLTVHAFITRIIPTDETAAAASKVTSVATPVATAVAVVPVPVPALRIPIGLGGIALEAEAVDRTGSQKAAMVWARGADSVTSRPRVSSAGDAYDLAASFGADFSKLLVTGATPFKTLPSPPSMHRVGSLLGGAPKESVCEAFGRSPGVAGFVGSAMGLPPEWTDKGAQVEAQR
jgi:hypothetical protein